MRARPGAARRRAKPSGPRPTLRLGSRWLAPDTVFVCASCAHVAAKWHGQCPSCGEWNALAEERAPRPAAARGRLRRAARRARRRAPVRLRDVQADRAPRLATGIGELDRLLGGGLVPGSLVLLGGSPGIGKSTLTTMALGLLQGAGRTTLYVSGEESAAQIRLRAERLEAGAAPGSLDVPVLAETDLDAVLAVLEAERPDVCVIDSVQTLAAADLTGAAGTVGQVREVATRIMEVAKRSGTAVLLVGHVTKEGALAGPRVLEHLVDAVLQFEGERERTYRTLRALKNRFGSTNDVGVFEMRDGGLVEVLDASARFVAEATRAPGQRRARRDGGLAAAARRGPGARLAERAGAAAARLQRDRPQPAGARARRARAPRGDRDRQRRRLRQRRRRRADRRARRRPRGRARGRQRRARDRRRRDRAAPPAAFGEIGLTGELRSVAHHDRRREEAAKFGLARSSRRTTRRRCATRCARRSAPTARAARPEAAAAVARLPPTHVARHGARCAPRKSAKSLVEWASMAHRSGDDLTDLDSRQEPRLVKSLEMVAPGTALREGIDNVVHARTGGLVVIGDPDELTHLFSGGIKLDIDYSPAFLYQVAKMDGAIVLNANATKIQMANVQLMPDPTILSLETGTRHRTAERVSKQTDALVIAVSARRDVVSLYVDGAKYILEDIPRVLAKANQALATLDKYRVRLDQVSTRLTALEFEGGATLHDVLTVLQRSELVTRMAVEIERYIVELGTEGRLIEMQLEETMVGTAADKAALVHDYLADDRRRRVRRRARPDRAAAAPGPARLRPHRRAARLRPQAQHA